MTVYVWAFPSIEYINAKNAIITNITFPKSLETIGEGAFFQCQKLKEVTFQPDSNLKTISNPDSHPSQHPNQQITSSQNGSHLTASLYNFENDDLIGVTEEYYTKVPSAGANNILNNKYQIKKEVFISIVDGKIFVD